MTVGKLMPNINVSEKLNAWHIGATIFLASSAKISPYKAKLTGETPKSKAKMKMHKLTRGSHCNFWTSQLKSNIVKKPPREHKAMDTKINAKHIKIFLPNLSIKNDERTDEENEIKPRIIDEIFGSMLTPDDLNMEIE